MTLTVVIFITILFIANTKLHVASYTQITYAPFLISNFYRDSFCTSIGLVFPPEHGQKFPGLGPANAAGLDGPQQERAEAGPGGSSTQAGTD